MHSRLSLPRAGRDTLSSLPSTGTPARPRALVAPVAATPLDGNAASSYTSRASLSSVDPTSSLTAAAMPAAAVAALAAAGVAGGTNGSSRRKPSTRRRSSGDRGGGDGDRGDRGRSSSSSAAAAAASATVGARSAAVTRKTKETAVDVRICIDGSGQCSSRTSIPFLDHMMDQLASHGLFDLTIQAAGDTWIDDHHTNEDVGLALGTALAQALGDRRGIARFGDCAAPLDEALVHVVLDLSGRPHLSCNLALPTERIGTYETQLVEHFFQSLVNTSGLTLHIRQLAGTNSHHIVEATFKAFARALRAATEADPRRGGRVASSKGVLTQS